MLSLVVVVILILLGIIGFILVYVGESSDLESFRSIGAFITIMAVLLSSVGVRQINTDKLEQEARTDIAEGHDVYVDGTKVDSDEVNAVIDFVFSTYKVHIDDDAKTVYLEKK